MLLAEEYNFRMWLSRLQCRRSFDLEWKWRPENLSEQVEHIGVSNVASHVCMKFSHLGLDGTMLKQWKLWLHRLLFHVPCTVAL